MKFHHLRVALQAESIARDAAREWIAGFPTEEVALLNRITAGLRSHNICDVGDMLRGPAVVTTEIVPLHRRGPNQTDKWGADIAVTFSDQLTGTVKSALLQFKKARNGSVTLDRTQLDSARMLPGGFDRAFVVAADERDATLFVRSNADCLAAFQKNAATHSSPIVTWTRSFDWLVGWLSCTIASDTARPVGGPFEAHLAASVEPAPLDLSDRLPFAIDTGSRQAEGGDRPPPLAWILVATSAEARLER